VFDVARVATYQSYTDPRLGIRESFLQPTIGGGRTVAVLSMPLDTTPSMGWVMCHSFGLEHIYLQPLESALARRLAGAGFAVLRFHAQGYGDSELGLDRMTIASHIDNAREAGPVLAEAAGTPALGFMGCRFGGTVAALAADRSGAEGLVVISPVVHGESYIRALMRDARVARFPDAAEVDETDDDEAPEPGPAEDLSIGGFPLRREVLGEISALDLTDELKAAHCRSLVLQVSRRPVPDRVLSGLAGKLNQVGARSELDILTHATALRFGMARFKKADQAHKMDSQAELTEAVVARVVAWCGTQEWARSETRR
jgi:pimeloyl-ACP methyl ester carboxylesterase